MCGLLIFSTIFLVLAMMVYGFINGGWIVFLLSLVGVAIYLMIESDRQAKTPPQPKPNIIDAMYMGAEEVVTKRGGLKGAILGGMAFGEIGAAIGSALPEETSYKHHFVVRYDNGDVKDIKCFEGTELYEKLIGIALWGRSTSCNKDIHAGSIKQALSTAQELLDIEPLSYTGLKELLEEDSFSEEQVAYAADNCGVDWNEQARRAAIEFLEFDDLSRSELIEMLEDEGFTHEQSVYGADNCGADWDEQATRAAKEALEYEVFSRKGLIEYLIDEGFTHEQAENAVNAIETKSN